MRDGSDAAIWGRDCLFARSAARRPTAEQVELQHLKPDLASRLRTNPLGGFLNPIVREAMNPAGFAWNVSFARDSTSPHSRADDRSRCDNALSRIATGTLTASLLIAYGAVRASRAGSSSNRLTSTSSADWRRKRPAAGALHPGRPSPGSMHIDRSWSSSTR